MTSLARGQNRLGLKSGPALVQKRARDHVPLCQAALIAMQTMSPRLRGPAKAPQDLCAVANVPILRQPQVVPWKRRAIERKKRRRRKEAGRCGAVTVQRGTANNSRLCEVPQMTRVTVATPKEHLEALLKPQRVPLCFPLENGPNQGRAGPEGAKHSLVFKHQSHSLTPGTDPVESNRPLSHQNPVTNCLPRNCLLSRLGVEKTAVRPWIRSPGPVAT